MLPIHNSSRQQSDKSRPWIKLNLADANFSKGYSLIELLIVLFIMLMLFTLVRANYADYARRKALDSAAGRLVSDLRLTQEYATAGRKPATCTGYLRGYYFTVTDASDTYSVSASCDSRITIPGKSGVTLPAGITLTVGAISEVLFKALGQGSNLTGDFNITVGQTATSTTRTVTVTRGGEIKCTNC